MHKRPEILILAGSTRAGSHNQSLADAFASELVNHDCDITRLSLADYDLPVFNHDLEQEKGVPENAMKLARQFHRHSAIILVSPEYNGSFTPLMKNTIDWISRAPSSNKSLAPFKNRLAAIAACSTGAMGGISGLGHLRDVLVRLGMQVISEQTAVANAENAFDDRGNLVQERAARLMKQACHSLVEKATLLG